MTLRLELSAKAEIELRGAAEWYDRAREGLGDAFLARVHESFQRIVAAPRLFPVHPADPRARRALVRKFPYAIVFAQHGETVRVLAIAHAKRRPAYWRKRS